MTTVYNRIQKGENDMTMTKCDVCGKIVISSDAASITIRPNNARKRFELPHNGSLTSVCEETFDLCKACVCKTLKKYYGKNFGEKGDNR